MKFIRHCFAYVMLASLLSPSVGIAEPLGPDGAKKAPAGERRGPRRGGPERGGRHGRRGDRRGMRGPGKKGHHGKPGERKPGERRGPGKRGHGPRHGRGWRRRDGKGHPKRVAAVRGMQDKGASGAVEAAK